MSDRHTKKHKDSAQISPAFPFNRKRTMRTYFFFQQFMHAPSFWFPVIVPPMVGSWNSKNSSLTKRTTRQLFPTAVSPNKTSLKWWMRLLFPVDMTLLFTCLLACLLACLFACLLGSSINVFYMNKEQRQNKFWEMRLRFLCSCSLFVFAAVALQAQSGNSENGSSVSSFLRSSSFSDASLHARTWVSLQ